MVRYALTTAVAVVCLFLFWETSEVAAAENHRTILDDYLAQELQREAVIARVEQRVGKPFADWTREDYATFLTSLDLRRESDLSEWSCVTGIPVVALRKGYEFFRSNAHLLADSATAEIMSASDLNGLRSEFNRRERKLVVRNSGDTPLPLRSNASDSIRVLTFTAQILGNADFADDRTSLEALEPYLARLDELRYLTEVQEALQLLPLSVIQVLRGKALYLSTEPGQNTVAIWHDVSTERSPDHVGLQVGVFHERQAARTNADALIRGIARIMRETVLQGGYYGLYEHPLQFPDFQELDAARQRIFGKRRDLLSQTAHGYVNAAAQEDPTANFVEHFAAYVTGPGAFRRQAAAEQDQGHPELMEKYLFMEQLVERTPTTTERTSVAHVTRFDETLQRQILEEYRTRFAQKDAVVTRVSTDFGKPFQEFDEADYAKFMASLDLRLDDDLWVWCNATGIPIVGLSQRSNFFHMNAHLVADVAAANRMQWSELTRLRSSYDRNTNKLTMVDGSGNSLPARRLPEDTIGRTESTGGLWHNADFSEDRIVLETLEPYLVRLADLENRQEFTDGIRLLPLSIVKILRGQAVYPTSRSRTSWTITWRTGTDRKVSFVGMQPGCFVEARRDQKRAPALAESLVERGLDSRQGSSLDSLVHEVGLIIDGVVIGRDNGSSSFPYQFPHFRSLRSERDRIFGGVNTGGSRADRGFINDHSGVSAQENFAEHFWAYLQDPAAFRSFAEQQQSEGSPKLMEKFLFMQALVHQTPVMERRLSPELIAEQNEQQWRDGQGRAAAALEEQLYQRVQKQAVVAALEQRLGKGFAELTVEDYVRFMEGLDLTTDDDLWKWSHVTGIPLVPLTQKSTFFYCNVHLLEDIRAAVEMPYDEVVALQRGYDEQTGRPTLTGPDGRPVAMRELPAAVLRKTARMGKFSYDEGFAEPRIVFEALAPYLTTLESVPNRKAIAKGLRALPLSVVKAFRGKAIYFTGHRGRSYSVGMPISNSTYEGFAGMQSGVFIDQNSDSLTTHNLVHEIGHVLDYTVIRGRYGSYLHAYQFPEIIELRPEKDRIFGESDDRVPQRDYGYISAYAMTNAQESFAEHFAYFILERERFLELAKKQQAEGHRDLMEKAEFMETLLEQTPVHAVRLSQAYIESLDESGEVSQSVGSSLDEESVPWRAVHRNLGDQRDLMASDLELAHARLLERAIAEDDLEAIKRLQDPPAPRPTGYAVLPEIEQNQPFSSQQLSERIYSLKLLSEGFAVEFRDAANLSGRVSGGEDTLLALAIPEFERLRERLEDLEDHLAYHAEWQPAVVEYAAFFAVRNQWVAEIREMNRLEAEGRPDEAVRIGLELSEKLAPVVRTSGLALVPETDGVVLPVTVVTDITDEYFLSVFREGVEAAFRESEAARAHGFAVDLELVRVAPEELYPEGVPRTGTEIDVDAHLQRFPSDALVLTTGPSSTYAFTGRAILIGSNPVTQRTLAHEFGHLLGFDDAYLRAYDGEPQGPYGVELVEWTGLTNDLMGNPRGGRVTEQMIETLIAVYGSQQDRTR